MDSTEAANFLALLNFRQQAADRILSQYQIQPNLTLAELAQVVMYLSDRLEEERQRQTIESQLHELKQQTEQLEDALDSYRCLRKAITQKLRTQR